MEQDRLVSNMISSISFGHAAKYNNKFVIHYMYEASFFHFIIPIFKENNERKVPFNQMAQSKAQAH